MIFISCAIIVFAANLQTSQETTCSYSCRQRYTRRCGWVGWNRCTEYRYTSCYQCCSGWTGYGCNTPICFGSTSCPNGGRCTRPDYCANCNRGYYSPRCARCTAISNCLEVYCSTSWDQRCDRCDGDYGPALGSAYKKSGDQRRCIKQCSWRTDSSACYPGNCTDAQCICSSGFSGADCRTMENSQAPVLSEHRATLVKGTTTLESTAVQGNTTTVYTNVPDFTTIRIHWMSSYQPTGLPNPQAGGHPYLHSVHLGIVSASVTTYVELADQSSTYPVASQSCTTLAAEEDFTTEFFPTNSTNTTQDGLTLDSEGTRFHQASQDNPATDLVICQFSFSLDSGNWTPASGDVLRYVADSTSGGYMQLYNRDNSNNIITRYYDGSTSSGISSFTFDFDDPYHCVGSSVCQSSMLSTGGDTTMEASVVVTWQDWADDIGGVHEYSLEVRLLSGAHGEEMAEIFDVPAVYHNYTESGQVVTLPHSGVYSFVLTIFDRAGNDRLSRRFVVFDDDPNDITVRGDFPLRVLTATGETVNPWLTSLDPSGGPTSLVLDWQNRFMNEHHLNQGLLKPIRSYISAVIDDDYDQNFGKRGRAAVPNALGIAEFRVLPDIDHSGGRTTVNATDNNTDNWINEATNTRVTYDLTLVDGDSVRFWLEARDIVGHFVRENVLIHVESSPPVIENFWLIRDGEVNIAIHNSVDLHDMSVAFRAYDIHSGIRTLEWWLFDNHTGVEVEHGHQRIAAVRIDEATEDCDPISCLCSPNGDCYAVDYVFHPEFHIGVHDYDYFITLTVTNHASLETTQTIKITVDTSPPQAGAVHDGIPGSNELDFQETPDLAAHWEGFFDKESGVKFYKFLFDDSCWNDATKVLTVKDNMTRTTSTHASWTAPSPGVYYVTVIAYNRALEPSEPICSDGVVVDPTPPELSQIVVTNAGMLPGVAKDAEGRVWFIDEHRQKAELVNASSDCSSKATLVDDLSAYPNTSAKSNYDTLELLRGDVACRWISGVKERFFLPAHRHISISWFGSDEESSIFDYQIGLSSNPSNSTPDLVTFMSTAGRNHLVMHHPHISQGSVFYLVVRAVNKAQLSTTKVVGPILVDTTPPRFVGRVVVQFEDEHLVAQWGDGGFVDDEDTNLVYQVGIGHSRGGTETLAFQAEIDYRIGPCLFRTSCAAFSPGDLHWHLHGDHEYYVSVRAQNGAGLATVGTSSVYRHIVQLPSLGVVLDVAPPGEGVFVNLGAAKDVDVQMDTTSISACWFGFEHPHLEISYEIAVGSGGEGSSDVSDGFIDVGSTTHYRLEGLDLTPLMTCYVTVRAVSEAGSVNVTSDGVKVIPEGQILNGTSIKDGLGCDQENISTLLEFSHHSLALRQPCEDDITYQSSTSDIAARWTIPEVVQPFVTNVNWAVEQEIEIYLDEETTTMEWITVLDYQDLGMAFQHAAAGVGLHGGGHYRSKVEFCHVSVCFQPIVTDGFWVLSQPPETGEVTVSDIKRSQNRTEISVVFQSFAHDYVLHDDPLDLMDYYEWSITEDRDGGALLTEWRRVQDLTVSEEEAHFTALYNGKLDHDVCLRLSVRGYNNAGLSSTASTEIVDCDDVMLIVPHVVIDADHEVNLEQNAPWPEPDKDYISSKTSLSAVWPTLRHRAYVWAVIEDTGSSDFGNLDHGLQYPCDHPLAKACGKTDREFVNVPQLSLEHGNRYRICIHADDVTLQHETWTQTLPSVSSCSNGVVIDMTPPATGAVWIGWDQHQTYQSTASELVLHWESFTDVEEHGLARHHSGIKYYEYAIGSTRGGSDVKEFTRLGIRNSVIVHNLRLQNGHRYYATVRATDFIGLSAQAMTDSITIDTSPPVVSDGHSLDVGGTFIQSTSSVSASWEDVFSDKESGIAYYEWAIGSHPGHADIMPFTKENSESGVSDPSRPLPLQEGHSYFISVKAIDRVGLVTLKTFGAFVVDASPPLAGHVFDGSLVPGAANHRDQDFQEDRTVIRAFWEGFHDPHSAVVGYSWKAGKCKGCSNVVSEQHVGLDTNVLAENLNLVSGLTYYVTVTACNAADLCTSVTSDGILVDDSPPMPGRVYDGGPGGGDISFQSSRFQLSAHWWGFHDPHSGLSHYEWRAGTAPGADDILPSTHIELAESALRILPEPGKIPVDAVVYITVRAYNWLGMWSEATSNGFRVDYSPPVVVDVPVVDGTVGMAVKNTQVRCDLIHFSWRFNDPESGIKDQYVSVTTHHNGDVNIPLVKIAGSETDHTFTNLTVHEGSQYIITVAACNHAGLCTEAKAEPLLVDCSPPSIGAFAVATESAANLDRHHIIWISPTEFLTFEETVTYLTNTTDSITTDPVNLTDTTDSVKSGATSFPTEVFESTISLNLSLSNSTDEGVGSTATSINSTTTSSNSTIEAIGSTVISVNSTTSLSNSNDEGVGSTANLINSTTSLSNSTNEAIGSTATTINSTTSLSNSTNEAINTTDDSINSTTEALGTTTSPPPYHSGWMTWVQDTGTLTGSLALAWLGFADVHSGISHYFVSVGRTYGGAELTPNGSVLVNHSTDGMMLDEGIAQTAIIPVEGSITDQAQPYLYISLWAVNGVGMPSGRHHSTFEVSPTAPDEGTLVLLRRCSSATCKGHCACAPINRACARTPGQCHDVTSDNPNTEIEVLDVLDLTFDDIDAVIDVDDSTSQYMMAAAWRVTDQKGMDIIWYEWSIGDDTSSAVVPVGVFDRATERVWFDIGQENHNVILLDKDRKLTEGIKYHVYIRAWYDANTYAVFRSDGITPDVTPPQISLIRGAKIKDLATADSTTDIDYTTDPDVIHISWDRAFLDNGMTHFQVSLSTYPGGEDVRQFDNHTFPASDSRTYFTGLSLESGWHYYSNIRAFDRVGLHTLRSSDGFMVDVRRPDPGLVFDGIDLHDVEYQNSTTLILASWHGFVDLESYIDHYEWCVGETSDPADDGILPCMDVGIRLSASKTLAAPLMEGIRYYSKISAVDAAGLQSMLVSSNGFVVDTTPPEPQEHITLGDNLIQNPSFEDIEELNDTASTPTRSSDDNPTSATSSTIETLPPTWHMDASEAAPSLIPVQWHVSSDSQFHVVTSMRKIAQDGSTFLSLHGTVSQAFKSTQGSHYQVTFFASHAVPSDDPLLNQEGRIEAPGLNRIFKLYDRPALSRSDQNLESIQWQEHRFYFTASAAVSTVKISSVGRSNGIFLDNVQVRPVTLGPSSGDGSVEVHGQFMDSWSSIQAKWHFVDPESPIVDYSWAIGTIRGGTQLQSFKSVGTQTDAMNAALSVTHGSNVFITVTAKNAADLVAVATSEPVVIDLTVPVIHYVFDGGSDQDIDFSADDKSITFSWSASDPESGIAHCEWAVGSEPGFDDILPNTETSDASSTVTMPLPLTIVNGQYLYVTLTCHNQVKRSSQKSSDGVTVVTEPPSSSDAVVKVKVVSETQYETRDNYQSQTNFLRASWDGFTDPFGIQYYECHLAGPEPFTTPWRRCGSTSETHLDWLGLNLVDGATYSLSVRGVNHAGLISQAIGQTIAVETSKPTSGDLNLLTTSWVENRTVHLSWNGLFSSSSSLVYEVSLGTIPGGSDVMQWVETMETGMCVSPLAPHTDYHLTVTAINMAGLSDTVNKIFICG